MTLSILMYALMVSSLVALVGTLVADAIRGPRPQPAPRRAVTPALYRSRSRLRERWECPATLRSPASTAARARRGGTPHSCRR